MATRLAAAPLRAQAARYAPKAIQKGREGIEAVRRSTAGRRVGAEINEIRQGGIRQYVAGLQTDFTQGFETRNENIRRQYDKVGVKGGGTSTKDLSMLEMQKGTKEFSTNASRLGASMGRLSKIVLDSGVRTVFLNRVKGTTSFGCS